MTANPVQGIQPLDDGTNVGKGKKRRRVCQELSSEESDEDTTGIVTVYHVTSHDPHVQEQIRCPMYLLLLILMMLQ